MTKRFGEQKTEGYVSCHVTGAEYKCLDFVHDVFGINKTDQLNFLIREFVGDNSRPYDSSQIEAYLETIKELIVHDYHVKKGKHDAIVKEIERGNFDPEQWMVDHE